jgi:hypothetical protein
MIVSKPSADDLTIPRFSRCSGVSSVSRARSVASEFPDRHDFEFPRSYCGAGMTFTSVVTLEESEMLTGLPFCSDCRRKSESK